MVTVGTRVNRCRGGNNNMIIAIILGVFILSCVLIANNMLDRIAKKLRSGEYEW